MKRSDGAKTWSTVLSELAQVKVSVEWERPTWRVSWQDGPTREALMSRAAALGRYRVGAPLPYEDLRFARSNCAVAVALAWFARGSPESLAAARRRLPRWRPSARTPATRRPGSMLPPLAAAELLRRVGHGDIAEMGALLARAATVRGARVIATAGPASADRVRAVGAVEVLDYHDAHWTERVRADRRGRGGERGERRGGAGFRGRGERRPTGHDHLGFRPMRTAVSPSTR